MAEASVVPIGRAAGRRGRTTPDPQARRRELVAAAMLNAQAWLQAGLDGDIPLEQSVCTASWALWAAEREVLKAALA